MNKAYSRINFQNAPSTATPLNATNLNKMDKAINDLDDRIIELSGYQEEAEESAEMASASASAAAKAAETATADAEARVNAIIEGLEVYTKEESDKKFASVIKQVATGSPILIKDSSDATAIDFKAYGRSEQIQYSGKNLFNIVIKPSVTDTDISCIFAEPITISAIAQNVVVSSAVWRVMVTYADGTLEYVGDSGYSLGEFPKTFNASKSNPIVKLTYRGGTTTMTSGKYLIQVERGTTVTEYEPYVGGVASPNPDYPQAIKSVSDSGYFDGELLQGYYGEKGDLVSNSTYICSKNFIPCNSGDTIKLKYATTMRIAQLVYYNENKEYISSSTVQNSVEELTDIAPSNAKYFMLNISESSSVVTPQTTKPISVTINGKYALIVKSKGKNLIPYPYRDTTHTDGNGITWTDNGDGTITANGTNNLTQTVQFYMILDGVMGLEPNTTYILNGCPSVGSLSTYNLRLILNRNVTGSTAIEYRDFGNGVTFTTPSDFKHCSIMLDVIKGTTVSNLLFKPMLRKAEVTDDTYEPYKETVTYIPLNEPLRSSLDGTVTDEVSLTEVTRRFKEVVFDGSDDEVITAYGNNYPHLFRISVRGVKETIKNIICTHFLSYRKANNDYSKNMIYTLDNYILINHIDITSVDELKTWLQANPITVQYELAEPITETIEPVDIVTYDNVTYLTASDNADMEVTYATDTKSYIDSKFAELHAALVNML